MIDTKKKKQKYLKKNNTNIVMKIHAIIKKLNI